MVQVNLSVDFCRISSGYSNCLNWGLSPPKPETFFASVLQMLLPYDSREEIRRKIIFILTGSVFFCVAKNVYLGVTGYVS